MERTGPGLMMVVSLALWKVPSPPPVTLALLITVPEVATLTVTLSAGYELPELSASARVQVRKVVGRFGQLHPVPLTAVAVKPKGRKSCMVTVPAVANFPVFRT